MTQRKICQIRQQRFVVQSMMMTSKSKASAVVLRIADIGLLDICESYGIEWFISYDSLKTKVMIFGRPTYSKPLYLNESVIEFVDHMKYLGITIVAGKEFSCSFSKSMSSFYCSANTILNTIYKPSEHCSHKTFLCQLRPHPLICM
jgi:hypothetical protein